MLIIAVVAETIRRAGERCFWKPGSCVKMAAVALDTSGLEPRAAVCEIPERHH